MGEASEFYTGLVAELYGALRSSPPEAAPYRRFVERAGPPSLELGCGDGDPLLELRAAGLEVEGLDSSADMLERCAARAVAAGLDVVLHHAPMESMALGRRYRSIYLAGPTFTLLPDDATAVRALRRVAAHLEPDGAALVPLFVPEPDDVGAVGVPRRAIDAEGRTLRVTVVSVERDDAARRQTTVLRYERDGDEPLERPWVLHWYDRDGFAVLAAEAGLDVTSARAHDGTPAGPDARAWSVVLRPAAQADGPPSWIGGQS